MKILLDQNISFKLKYPLRKYIKECVHTSDVGLSDSDDEDIWKYAEENGFSILTQDIDFFHLSLLLDCPPFIILIRKGNMSSNEMLSLIIENINLIIRFISNKDQACLQIN